MAVSRGRRFDNSNNPNFLTPVQGVPDGMIEEFDIAIKGFQRQDDGFTTLTFNCSDESRQTNLNGFGKVVWDGLHRPLCNKCGVSEQLQLPSSLLG